MPDSDESLFTIAEFGSPDDYSFSRYDSHDTWDSISYPKDFNPYTDHPDHASIQDVTDESKGEDDTSQKVAGTSEAIRSQMEDLLAQEILTPLDYEVAIEVDSDETLPTEYSDSASQSSDDSTMPL